MNDFKKTFLPLFGLLFVLLSVNLCAQEKEKSSLSKKLSGLKGKVEKITVQVDGKDVVFEGKEAETLVKRMKSSAGARAFNYSIGGTRRIPKIVTFSTDDSADFEELEELEELEDITVSDSGLAFSVSGKDNFDGDMKKIKLEKKEGKTSLSVTTKDENGEEVTKEYEGEEADKYLKENNIGSYHFSTKGKGRISAFGPGRFWIQRGGSPKRVIIEKDDSDNDEDSSIEVFIQKGDTKVKSEKAAKSKIKVKKVEKED